MSGNRVEITSGVATVPAPVFKLMRVLKRTNPYMRGSDVKLLQLELNEWGFSCGAADGVYGGGRESVPSCSWPCSRQGRLASRRWPLWTCGQVNREDIIYNGYYDDD